MWRTAGVVLLAAFMCSEGKGDVGEIHLELMASPVSWTEWSPGHAFMCVILHLRSGLKDDCFGFYPRQQGPKAFIGSSGAINSEFKKNPSRFTAVTVSLKRKISEAQRSAIYKLADAWNSQNYSFTSKNCLSFVHDVAGHAGLRRPEQNAFQQPDKYVAKLRDLNP